MVGSHMTIIEYKEGFIYEIENISHVSIES